MAVGWKFAEELSLKEEKKGSKAKLSSHMLSNCLIFQFMKLKSAEMYFQSFK